MMSAGECGLCMGTGTIGQWVAPLVHSETKCPNCKGTGRIAMTAAAPPEKMTNAEIEQGMADAYALAGAASHHHVDTVEMARLAIALHRRLSAPAALSAEYLDQMQAHVGEGGQLSHRNGVDLLRALMATRSTKEA